MEFFSFSEQYQDLHCLHHQNLYNCTTFPLFSDHVCTILWIIKLNRVDNCLPVWLRMSWKLSEERVSTTYMISFFPSSSGIPLFNIRVNKLINKSPFSLKIEWALVHRSKNLLYAILLVSFCKGVLTGAVEIPTFLVGAVLILFLGLLFRLGSFFPPMMT